MENDVENIVDAQINERLKQIMDQRNIYNKVVIAENNTNNDLYGQAANRILSYISLSKFIPILTDEIMKEQYDFFLEHFSPEKISSIPDDKLLETLFYTNFRHNDSLCYYLEYHPQIREGGGSIAGGSAYKFGLFQRQEDQAWITGSPSNPIELDYDEALKKGKEIRDALIKGAELIKSSGLKSIADYEKLDVLLNDKIGKYASMAWVHKYYHMIFPNLFSTWHSSDWQKHILYAYGIKPSEKYYGRSGQLAKIASLASLSMNIFEHASYNCFGDIKKFYRIEAVVDNCNIFLNWYEDGFSSIDLNLIGSLEKYKVKNTINKKVLVDQLLKFYTNFDKRLAIRKAGLLINFYNANNNSVFVAMNGEKLLGLGDKIGDYYYVSKEDSAHRKKVNWLSYSKKFEDLPIKSEGLLEIFTELQHPENLLYLYKLYYNEIIDIQTKNESVEGDIMEIIHRAERTDKTHPLNQIIYGAPGTGKTYYSIEYAMSIIEKRSINNTFFSTDDRKSLMMRYHKMIELGQVIFTTFHQSYGYEEFIQGLRPETNSGNIQFNKTDGIFKKIATKAMLDHKNNYVIIIDEINRGNISKIFGELITLIEDDKRWGEINQMVVTLPMGDRFTVPNNLYIIGTMNSADKSISLIDTALRRRFTFIEMAPNPNLISDHDLRNALIKLNEYIKSELRSTDLLLGHSFFIGYNANDLDMILNKNVIPLLYEYFYDDERKVKKAIESIGSNTIEIDNTALGRIKVKKRLENA